MGRGAPVSDALRLVALGVTVAGLGLVLQAAFGLALRGRGLVTALGLAPGAGLALCGLVATILALVAVPVRLATVLPAAAVVVGVVLAARRSRPRSDVPAARRLDGRAMLVVEVLCVLGMLAVAVIAFRLFLITPLDSWDGWAIWGTHAHAIYVDRGIGGAVFHDPIYRGLHPEYPVLYPSLEALASDAIGRFDVGLLHAAPAALLCSVALGAWGLLRGVVPGAVAAATGLAAFALTPVVWNLLGNYADGAVAGFTALGLLALAVWLRAGAGWAVANATLFLAAAGLTKAEGLLFTIAALAAAAAAAGRAGRPRRALLSVSTLALAPAVLWHVAGRTDHRNRAYDFGSLLDPGLASFHVHRISDAGDAMARTVAHSGSRWPVGIALAIVAVAACLLARVDWPALFVAVYVGVSCAGLLLTYASAADDLEWLVGTSVDRVVQPVVMGPVLLAPLLAWLAIGAHFRESSAGDSGEPAG
jgi:hypothetical protein